MTLLSIRAASRMLRCDPRTLRHAITHGSFPAVLLGKRYKVELHSLARWASGRLPVRITELPVPTAPSFEQKATRSGAIVIPAGGSHV